MIAMFFLAVPISNLFFDFLHISNLIAALASIILIMVLSLIFYRRILMIDRIFISILSIHCLKEFILIVVLMYGMLVSAFATFYYCIDLVCRHNFSSYFHWLYFSVITLTTVGYGDIAPINGFMRLLVSLECFIGYISVPIIFTIGLRLLLKENKL